MHTTRMRAESRIPPRFPRRRSTAHHARLPHRHMFVLIFVKAQRAADR